MFRIGSILCGLALIWGCSSPHESSDLESWSKDEGKLRILSTTAMIDDLVGEIGGDRVNHIALIFGEIDPHSYELVKGDSEKFNLANLVFYNGLGLEHGASLHYQLKNHPNAVALGDLILEKFPEEKITVDHQVDPHIWMDISLWSRAIDPIAQALIQKDPAGESTYLQNAETLRKKMGEAHTQIYTDLQQIPQEKRYIVTSHDAFNYFTRAYLAEPSEVETGGWEKRFDAPEGLAPEGQLSSSDIQQVINHLIEYHIEIVFPESNVSQDSLKKVIHACAQKGLIVTLSKEALYGDSMGPKGSGAHTYLNMIEYDASVLEKAWKKGSL